MRVARHPGDVHGDSSTPPVNYIGLAEFLDALAYPVRLELLHELRFPHEVSELEITPHRRGAEGGEDRSLARQTVQEHVDKLVAAGFVQEEQPPGGSGARRYQTDSAKLYALVEDLRELSTMYAGRGADPEATGTIEPMAEPQDVDGPHLVLMHGVYEGKAFPLTDGTRKEGGWAIGRSDEAPISLDYDPYVSTQNSFVERRDDGFALRDLPQSKNGTWVNWQQLPESEPRILEPGDAIGVGRSILSFVPK
jgi:hypothetical protein